ncbi:MAG TPA: cation diffusion facilitator family transporter [Gaiellaceae bacterium]|jgi:cobalt-zinc-cadmium efflux system protein
MHHHGDTEARPLAEALALIAAFMVAEVVLGVLAHSLALLSDAAHMLTDAGALGLGVWVARLVRRPPGGRLTFGLRRAEILSAQANGATLLLLALLIVVEAARRLANPPHVHGALVVGTACAGAVVNLAALRRLGHADRSSLNVEGNYLHLLTDFYAFAATAVAGVVVWTTGFERADPIASLAVAASMLWAAWPLLRRSGRILLEAAPEGIDPDELAAALHAEPAVVQVHDLHVWSIGSGFPALSAHVLVQPGDDCHGTRQRLEALLQSRFGINHTTLQVEHARDELLQVRSLRSDHRDR